MVLRFNNHKRNTTIGNKDRLDIRHGSLLSACGVVIDPPCGDAATAIDLPVAG